MLCSVGSGSAFQFVSLPYGQLPLPIAVRVPVSSSYSLTCVQPDWTPTNNPGYEMALKIGVSGI